MWYLLFFALVDVASANGLIAIGSGSDRGQCNTCDDNTQCAVGLECKSPGDLSHNIDYTWAHSGICSTDQANNQDYIGTGFTMESCANACRHSDTLTDRGRNSLGFAFTQGTGGCVCQAHKSHPDPECDPVDDPAGYWQRYDFDVGWQADYHFAHTGECNSASNAAEQTAKTDTTLQGCADACRGETWGTSQHAKGFIFNSARAIGAGTKCYCESVHSYPHSECRQKGTDTEWMRYDFDIPYAFVHYGYCTAGDAANQVHGCSGTAACGFSIEQCASACKGLATDNGRDSLGFGYRHDNGDCYCEAPPSHPHPECTLNTNTNWARYDFVNYSPVFEYQHEGRCQDALVCKVGEICTGITADLHQNAYVGDSNPSANIGDLLIGNQHPMLLIIDGKPSLIFGLKSSWAFKMVRTDMYGNMIQQGYLGSSGNPTTLTLDQMTLALWNSAQGTHNLDPTTCEFAKYCVQNPQTLREIEVEQTSTLLTGTDLEKATQCSRVCMGALIYTTTGVKAAKGFVVGGSGECFCESDSSGDSPECADKVAGWKRYDFVREGVYRTSGSCFPLDKLTDSGHHGAFTTTQVSTVPQDWSDANPGKGKEEWWVDNCRIECIAHSLSNNNGVSTATHFNFEVATGKCYCMQTQAGAHSEHPCETGIARVDSTGWTSYTIWNDAAIPDVPRCDHSGVDVRGMGVCIASFPSCISSETPLDGLCQYTTEVCTEVELPREDLVLHMYDSWGDGWNGNTIKINGVSKTLSSGSYGTSNVPWAATIKIEDGVTGSYVNEVTWKLKCGATVLVQGSASSGFTTVINPCPPGTETQCTGSVEFCEAGMTYNIAQTPICDDNLCSDSPDPLTSQCSYGGYTCEVGDTYNDGACARNCTVGYVQSGEACGKCIGTEYQDEPGQAQCKDCSANEISSPDGASCVCEPGAAGSPCEVCQAGKFVSEVCESCPEGQYQDQDGQPGCKVCAAGNFVNQENTTCTVCPITIAMYDWGSGCPSWSTNDGCHCDCGNSGFTGTHCDVCGYGKGYNITMNRCEDCRFGYVNVQDSHTAACALLGCDENFGYASDIPWDPNSSSTNSGNCQPCPGGSESPAGDGQCVVNACLENQNVTSGICVDCPLGKINAAGDDPSGPDTECDYPCSENEYYDTTPGSEKCTPCTFPYISDGTKDTCWHQASKYITDKTIHEAVHHPAYYDNHISTSVVTNMDRLFKDRKITSGYLEKMKDWDISSVTSMREMFLGAEIEGDPDFDITQALNWTIPDVDKTRWKTVVDVSYGGFNADEDIVEVCPGMKLKVTWDITAAIYESDVPTCNNDGSPFLKEGTTGVSHVLDFHADPGKRRYFCDRQDPYSAFEVYCNADYDISTYCNSFVGTYVDTENGSVLGESCALSNTGLRSLIYKWTADKIRIEAQHGPLSEWDVSYVTDMSELFKDNTKNPDIRKWDMSNVVHAERMFQNSGFAFFIDNKDFSSLQSASEMFDSSYTGRACGEHLARAGAKGTLSSVGANGLSNCLTDTNMHIVAGEWWTNRVDTWNKTGHIDDWDVTEVTNMKDLFKNQVFSTESLSDWQTGSVTTMYAMFENTNFNGDIRFWDVRQVTSFSRMFYNNAVFNYDLSRFEVFSKEATDMTNSRFYIQNVLQLDELYKEEVLDIYAVYDQWKSDKVETEEVYGPISEWMVHSVLDMSGLFKGEDFNEDISRWVVSSVTDMSSMFEESTFDQPIGGWSTVNVRNMSRMFKGTVFNQDIQLWNVTKVEDMTEMFANSVFTYSIGDWDLFATAADKIKAPREPDRCIIGVRSESIVLNNPRGDPSATRECYELCDNLVTTKRLDIEGRNRWRSWGRVIADINTSNLTEPYTTWHNFGIVTTSTENHTCTCLESVEPINGQCTTTSEFQYVFQFRDMLDEGLFDGNTAYRQPMCGLGWRYRDLSSMSQAQLGSADTCNICGYDAVSGYTSGHGQSIRECGLCVGEFRFDYCRPSLRSFTLQELYGFEKLYFRDYGGSLVVDENGNPLPDNATDDTINAGYVNKFACNCMYEGDLKGCLVVNGRKQVRMAEWYAPGLTNFSDYIDAQGNKTRYYCELDFLQGREVRFASGFNSVECTDDVLLTREECELVGGDWDGSCSKCLEPCADPTTGVKEISVGRVCTECESGKTVFNNECVLCPNGKYTDENHAWCGKCPAGTRGVNGRCISCVEDLNENIVEGFFSSFEGAIRCETCSANTFSIGTECAQCPQGYISNASKSSCEESTLCHKGNTSVSQTLAGDYCVEDECIRGFKSKVAEHGGFTCVSSCEHGRFVEKFTKDGIYCICNDRWYGDDCNKCDDLYDYSQENPPKCQERFCVDESKRDCICRNDYVRPLVSQTCIDGDLKEICKDGESDCMCNISSGLEWTEHGICKHSGEENIIVLECPVYEIPNTVVHPPEECFPGLRVNDFECETFRRIDVNGIGAECDSICEKDDYESGARCCISYSWVCLEEMCNSTQYVHTPWVTGPADTEGCCLERELCSSYTSTCSNAGGKASRIDFASTRAVTFFANDTVFLDDCCYNYQYKVEKGWLGKRCNAGKDIETEEECDIAQATADDRFGMNMLSWGTYSGVQWARCSAYEQIGSGGTYRDICRK